MNSVRLHDISKRFVAPAQRRAPLYRQLTRFFAENLGGGQTLALDRICIEIPRGKVVGVVGQNGAGKTTLLRVIAGIYTPSNGLREVTGRLACHFGGEASLAPALKVADNIFLCGAMLGMTHTETSLSIDTILELADLAGERQSRLEHLSFGKQQRLFFGVLLRAMSLRKADVYLFDEWLSGADRRYQTKAEELFRTVRTPEQTLIISSHNVERLRRMCDLAIYLQDGRLRLYGPVDEVLDVYMQDCD